MTNKQINTLNTITKYTMPRTNVQESAEVTDLRNKLRQAKAKELLDRISKGVESVRKGGSIDDLRKACASFVSRTQIKGNTK